MEPSHTLPTPKYGLKQGQNEALSLGVGGAWVGGGGSIRLYGFQLSLSLISLVLPGKIGQVPKE